MGIAPNLSARGSDLTNIEQYDNSDHRLKSILFQRDGDGRISAIFTPENLDTNGIPIGPPTVTYEYDAAGNLVKVSKIMDSGGSTNRYATTQYRYTNPRFSHLLTEVIDARGVSIMKAEFDSVGRLIGTVDAYGRHTSIEHDLSSGVETVFDRLGNPTRLAYDDHGNLLAKTDALGNTTRYTYDSNNHQASVTDSLGNTTFTEYDTEDHLLSVIDPLGGKITYAYNANGNRVSVTDRGGHTTTNLYDSSNRLIATVDASGTRTEQNYDSQGNVSAYINPLGAPSAQFTYDSDANVKTMVGPSGAGAVFEHDNDGNLSKAEFQWVNPENTNDVRTVGNRYYYNVDGQITKTIDPFGNETTTVYDEVGNVVQTTDSVGLTTSRVYDARGNQIQTKYPDGSTVERVYDANDRITMLVDRHQPGQSANGTLTTYDPVGRVTLTERLADVFVNIVTTTNASAAISSAYFASAGQVLSSNVFEYDAAGRMLAQTDESGQTTTYEYDALGHNTAITDGLGNRTEFEFDAGGRQSLMRDPLGREFLYVYDALGQRVRTIYPDGRSTSTTYDSAGDIVSETDQVGQTRDLEYDGAGNATAIALPAVTDPESGNATTRPRFEYGYDGFGNRNLIRDPKGRETKFGYDELQRMTLRVLPLGQKERTVYDAVGRLVRQTDFKGQVEELSYDGAGRVTNKTFYASGSSTPSYQIAVVYDDLQRTRTVIEPRGVTKYTSDADGRVTEVQSPQGTIHYEYDSATGMRTRTWTTNSDIRYSYDRLNRLTSVTVVKQGGEILSKPQVTSYTYDAVGDRETMSLPNGITTQYEYDNWLTRLTHWDASSNALTSFSYAVNGKGLRTGVSEIKRQTAVDAFGTNSYAFVYDALDRLVAETNSYSATNQAGYSSHYTYDLVGNRLERQVQVGDAILTTSYTYDDNDRLLMESNSLASASASRPSGAFIAVPIRGQDGKTHIVYRPRPSAYPYLSSKKHTLAPRTWFSVPGSAHLHSQAIGNSRPDD